MHVERPFFLFSHAKGYQKPETNLRRVQLTLTKLYDLRSQSWKGKGLYLCQIPLQLDCAEDSYADISFVTSIFYSNL